MPSLSVSGAKKQEPVPGGAARSPCSIARRLAQLPTGTVGDLAHPISDWLEKVNVNLATHCSNAREALWQQLISALLSNQTVVQSGVVRQENRDPDWVTEALLRHVQFRGRVWEPCCGTGAIW